MILNLFDWLLDFLQTIIFLQMTSEMPDGTNREV